MKKNLEILKIEPKLDKNEKKYWRVNTSDGWMTCWDSDICDKLKGQQIASVEVTEKEGTNFKGEKTIFYNITECYDEDKPEVVKVGERAAGVSFKSQNSTAAMYASYAKDLVVAGKPKEEAVEIVKFFKEAFE